VPDLKEWLGRDEIYTYWGQKASKRGNNPTRQNGFGLL